MAGAGWDEERQGLAVHARALDGPAIWHDPQLLQAFFFRGDVVAAMEEAALRGTGG